MLITNILDFKNLDLYKCDKKESFLLQVNGFYLISCDKDWYYFRKSRELINFLKLRGGDNIE